MHNNPVLPIKFTVTLNNEKQHHFLLLDGMIEFVVENAEEQKPQSNSIINRLRARFGMWLIRLGLSLT